MEPPDDRDELRDELDELRGDREDPEDEPDDPEDEPDDPNDDPQNDFDGLLEEYLARRRSWNSFPSSFTPLAEKRVWLPRSMPPYIPVMKTCAANATRSPSTGSPESPVIELVVTTENTVTKNR